MGMDVEVELDEGFIFNIGDSFALGTHYMTTEDDFIFNNVSLEDVYDFEEDDMIEPTRRMQKEFDKMMDFVSSKLSSEIVDSPKSKGKGLVRVETNILKKPSKTERMALGREYDWSEFGFGHGYRVASYSELLDSNLIKAVYMMNDGKTGKDTPTVEFVTGELSDINKTLYRFIKDSVRISVVR